MKRIGDDNAGFSVDFDAGSNTVRVRGWGFWNAHVASQFGAVVRDACSKHLAGAALVMDMTELKPMRDEGQRSFGSLLGSLPGLGIVKTTVSTSSQLTKLQLLRIANECGKKGAVYVT